MKPVRLLLLSLVVVFSAVHASADRVDELTRIHIEAIGGKKRIAELKAMRATGQVSAGGKQMRFTLIAARPDRIRLETERGNRTLVQGSDGVNPAWEFDTGSWPPRYRDMEAAAAKTFTADAEFDDPLIAGAARGFAFDYAGEVAGEGKKLLRILVTRRLTQTFSLLLDPDTFFIVRRVEERKNALGQSVFVATQFDDFRPVNGVLIPHRVALVVDGQLKQRTQIESIEPNPELATDTFTRPRGAATSRKR